MLLLSRNAILVGNENPSTTRSTFRVVSLTVGKASPVACTSRIYGLKKVKVLSKRIKALETTNNLKLTLPFINAKIQIRYILLSFQLIVKQSNEF
jgi:hypothetical protein